MIVGDHDLGELRGQIGRLRDHPDAGLRPAGAADHPAEVATANVDAGIAALGAHLCRAGGKNPRDGDGRDSPIHTLCRPHFSLSLVTGDG